MAKGRLKHDEGESQSDGRGGRRTRPAPACGASVAAWLLSAVAVSLPGLTLQPRPANALDCLPTGQPLVKIPELRSDKGVLRGTIRLVDQEQRLAFRFDKDDSGIFPRLPDTPGPNMTHRCKEQFVRTFQGLTAESPGYGGTDPSPANLSDPMPGPTLRARVGDVVQLTFLNQIDADNFDQSVDRSVKRATIGIARQNMDPASTIDRAEKGLGSGCDTTIGIYPKGPQLDKDNRPGGLREDTFPNCFHGSSTGNIHFHGTHTNPNTTGDNIFIQVRPSLRLNGDPVVTDESVKAPFARFFAECERRLRRNPLLEWPKTWADLPTSWTGEQKKLLQEYDDEMPSAQRLWPPNARQLKAGLWPLYYIGAYPFCFMLPEHTKPAERRSVHGGLHMDIPADERRSPKMGQAPGTHWYHAHKHGSTALNVANGLTGVFIIEGKSYDDALNEFYRDKEWTRRQPVLVINQLGVTPNLAHAAGRPQHGEDFSVNGRHQPMLTMRPGEVQLWRIVNTSSRSGVFFLGPPDLDKAKEPNPKQDFQWRQLAQDGVQFADETYEDRRNRSLLLAAGNRADLLVRAPSTSPGKPVAVKVRHAVNDKQTRNNDPVTLMFVDVAGTAIADADPQSQFITSAPTRPDFLDDIADSEVRSTKIITFQSKGPWHTIDGKLFDDTVGQVVRLDSTEEWKIENATIKDDMDNFEVDHPFHIHINPFQVVEVFDPNEVLLHPKTGEPLIIPGTNTPYPKYVVGQSPVIVEGATQCELKPQEPETWKPCVKDTKSSRIWRDVFPIPSGRKVSGVPIPGYFKMRSRFVDYPGWFVMHCHILAHEDRGMMTVVHVAPFTPRVTHH